MKIRRRTIFRMLMLLYLGLVAYLCFARFNDIPHLSKTIFGIATDKLVHFCMFFPFPILAFYSYDNYTRKVWQAVLMASLCFLCGSAIALATEYIQDMIPYRSKDMLDLRADIIALALSSIIVLTTDILQIYRERCKVGKER